MSKLIPYYKDDYVTIYNGDCREILPNLTVDAIISDPPYGINYKSGHNTGYRINRKGWSNWRRKENFAPIVGDDRPFDPTPFLNFPDVVLFGAIHFASRLPDSKGWIVWDKREGQTPDLQADCEFAWTNKNIPARLFGHYWRGLLRKGHENNVRKVHPNQKPQMLMQWIIEKYATNSQCICDPFMGSGTTLLAAKTLRRKSIGIEIEQTYCEIAVKRLRQEVLNLNNG